VMRAGGGSEMVRGEGPDDGVLRAAVQASTRACRTGCGGDEAGVDVAGHSVVTVWVVTGGTAQMHSLVYRSQN
jgi:hypothetical protein